VFIKFGSHLDSNLNLREGGEG